MKFNIAYPATGCQKVIELDDPKKLGALNDKRMAQEIEGDILGDEFKGYIFRISGGNDKQGFAMKQGVLVPHRVRLLLKKGMSGYRERRTGQRHRRSVRGCITGPDLAVMNLVIVKKGAQELPGLTDKVLPRRLGPKRASKIRKLFDLSKDDDVRQYVNVLRREIPAKKEGKKPKSKAPKIQRLVTPERLQRKKYQLNLKKQRAAAAKTDAAEYKKLLKKYTVDQRKKRQSQISKVREERASVNAAAAAPAKAAAKPKVDAKAASKPAAKPAAAKPAAKPASTTAKPAAKPATATTAKPTATATKPAAKPASSTTPQTKPAAAAPSAKPAAAAKPAEKKPEAKSSPKAAPAKK